MQIIIWRVAVLSFTLLLVWIFQQPVYLCFLVLLFLRDKPEQKSELDKNFKALDAKLQVFVDDVNRVIQLVLAKK